MLVTLTTVLNAIKRQARLPSVDRRHVHVAGLPGWGKTRSMEALSPIHVTIPCPLISREDVCVPVNDEGRMTLIIHPMIQAFLDEAEANPKRPAVMIFDEIMQAGVEDQKAYASIIYDRVIAGIKLPLNVITVSTGNLRKHQSGVGSTLAHLIGRMKLYEIKPDNESWFDWGADRLHPDVMAYVAMKPAASYCTVDSATDEELAAMYRDAARDYLPYPSARSWTALSDELKVDASLDVEDFASHVGETRALEFNALRGVKIPGHADLLEGRAKFPEEPMAQWMCIVRCGQELTPGNSEKTIGLVRDLNPEMVEIFLRVAGRIAIRYMKKEKNEDLSNGRVALLSFPGFQETLFAPDSRYAQSLEVE